MSSWYHGGMPGNTSPHALTLRLPTELHETVRTMSFLTRRSINDIATEALTQWCETNGSRERVCQIRTSLDAGSALFGSEPDVSEFDY